MQTPACVVSSQGLGQGRVFSVFRLSTPFNIGQYIMSTVRVARPSPCSSNASVRIVDLGSRCVRPGSPVVSARRRVGIK